MTKTNSRRKGITGEKEVARMFRRWFPECKRSFGQSRKGHEQPDLIGGIESEFFVEVKFWAKERGTPKNLSNAWAKLIEDMGKYSTPIINDDDWPIEPIMVYRLTGCKPNMGWRVVVLWQQYIGLAQYRVTTGHHIVDGGKERILVVPWEVFAKHLDSVMEVHDV